MHRRIFHSMNIIKAGKKAKGTIAFYNLIIITQLHFATEDLKKHFQLIYSHKLIENNLLDLLNIIEEFNLNEFNKVI